MAYSTSLVPFSQVRQSYKTIFSIAWPVTLSNLTVPLLGSVDIAMMGHFGSKISLAATALGALVFDFLFWGFGFLRMSTTGLVAQKPKDHALIKQLLLLSLILGGLLIVLQWPLFQAIQQLIDTKASVIALLNQYFLIRIYASLATLGNYVILGYLFGQQDTFSALVLQVLTNVLAIALDFILVCGFNWDIKGLAIANVIAQSTGAVIGLIYLQRRYQIFKGPHQIPFNIKSWQKLLSINFDIFLRTLCLLITFAIFTREGARLGVVVVAANAILMNFQELMAYTLDGFTIATESLIGKAFGERNWQQFINVAKSCTVICAFGACLFSLLFLLFGEQLTSVLTDIAAVQVEVHKLLFWIVLMPLLSFPSFVLDGIFIGATWSKEMRNSMLLSMLAFMLSWHFVKHYHANGLWLSMSVFMICRCVLLLERLLKKHRAWQDEALLY